METMVTPLGLTTIGTLNLSHPLSSQRVLDQYEPGLCSPSPSRAQPPPLPQTQPHSPPAMSPSHTTAGMSPEQAPVAKPRHSRVLSGHELSPLKILTEATATVDVRSPRKKASPERRFPVRISSVSSSHVADIANLLAGTQLLEEEQDEDDIAIKEDAVVGDLCTDGAADEQSDPKLDPKRIHQYVDLEPVLDLEAVIRQNDGLMTAIEIIEDEKEENNGDEDGSDTTATIAAADDDERTDLDDTVVSNFSSFSAVPHTAILARLTQEYHHLHHHPHHHLLHQPQSPIQSPPRPANNHVPSTAAPGQWAGTSAGFAPTTPRSSVAGHSPGHPPWPNTTPRAPALSADGNTTNLLDFTAPVRLSPLACNPDSGGGKGSNKHKRTSAYAIGFGYGYNRHSARPMSTPTPTPPRGQHILSSSSSSAATGSLLDFDLPPLSTPRSIPSVTPRELESLKSGFLSEISGLRASLSGKEAEVQSLKAAVADAERRAGESLETVHEERTHRARLEADRDVWERRGHNMDTILRSVRQELARTNHDRDKLEAALNESEKRREAVEIMAQEAECRMAGMRAYKVAAGNAATYVMSPEDKEEPALPPGSLSPSMVALCARETEQAAYHLAHELHGLYRSKNEIKQLELRQHIEAKAEKRLRKLEARIGDLDQENDRLRLDRDAIAAQIDLAAAAAAAAEAKAGAAEKSADQATRIRELDADVQRLEAVAASVRADNDTLRQLLETERVEKGELVQVAEEMMAMQSFVATATAATAATAVPAAATPAPTTTTTTTTVAAMASTPSAHARPMSGIRPPGPSGAGALNRRSLVAPHGLPRPGSMMGRSGIMNSIEKMGSYGRKPQTQS